MILGPDKDYVRVFNNFISNEDSDYALDILKRKPKVPWRDNLNVNIVPHMFIESFAFVSNQAFRVTEKIRESYNIDSDVFVIDTQMGTWNTDGAGSGTHEDTYGMEYTEFSSIIYLSGDYEGGELDFPELGFTYKPQRGDLITFPSQGYVHEVLPVNGGNRSTLVGFYSTINPQLWSESYPKPNA
tara:strand:- start:29563 stop:30117 length:555 start_codon:yes stop_codon:yes gene_type:complete